MEYIVHSRFNGHAICGDVDLPENTKCECVEGMILYHGNPICVVFSENSHRHFAINNDGKGKQRGDLTKRIVRCLASTDENYQKRWDLIWDDIICQKYKDKMHGDYWLWNHAFYKAKIEDLQHIAELIGA